MKHADGIMVHSIFFFFFLSPYHFSLWLGYLMGRCGKANHGALKVLP